MKLIKEFLSDVEKRIYDRGVHYYSDGMVEHLVREGRHCSARVSGSDWEPYEVDILLSEENQVRDWNCTCPYDGGAVCKHVVAVLLGKQYPEQVFALCIFQIRTTAERAQDRRDYRQLCALLSKLAGFGGNAEARQLIMELQAAYSPPQRHTGGAGECGAACAPRIKTGLVHQDGE